MWGLETKGKSQLHCLFHFNDERSTEDRVRRNTNRWFVIQSVVSLSYDMMDAKSLDEFME